MGKDDFKIHMDGEVLGRQVVCGSKRSLYIPRIISKDWSFVTCKRCKNTREQILKIDEKEIVHGGLA